MLKKYQTLLFPLLAAISGLVLGAIIMFIFGYDPIWGYEELFYSAFGNKIGRASCRERVSSPV